MANQQSQKKYRFTPKPIDLDELLEAFEWAVENLVPYNGVTCLFGKPGAFKTFLAIALAWCKAIGMKFCGRWVGPPCKVLYIAADAPKGVKLRIRAWIEAHWAILEQQDLAANVPNLIVLDIPINLHEPRKDVDVAIADLQEQRITAEVLIVDTWFHSSVGAKMTVPEEMLPLLTELRRLMEAIGAKSCIVVHHPTKDGEEFFGSDTLRASVEAMIKLTWEDATTAKVTCVRMREDAFFDTFIVHLKPQTIRTKPDRRGVDKFTTLVVDVGAVATRPVTKAQRALETMEVVLELHLGNKATFTEWCEKIHEVTTRKDNSGKVIKKGWSEKTFERKLKKLVEQGRVVGGGGNQGDCYSVVYSEQAKKARGTVQPEEPDEDADEAVGQDESAVTNNRHVNPFQGIDGGDGGFVDPQAPSKHRQNENDGASNESRVPPDPVVMTDLEKEIEEGLKKSKLH